MSTSPTKYVSPKVAFPKFKGIGAKERSRKLADYLRSEKIWDIDELVKQHRDFCANHPVQELHAQAEAKSAPNQWRSNAPNTFDECAFLLEAAGFVKLTDTRGFELSDRIYRDNIDLRHFQLWAHPSGLLADCSSSSYRFGYPTYNHLALHAQIDIGLGRLAMTGSLVGRTHGSSNYDFSPQGGHINVLSCRSQAPEDLLSFLRDIQASGRIVPFDKQLRDPFMGTIPPHMLQSATHPLLVVENNKAVVNHEQTPNACEKIIEDLTRQSWDVVHQRAIEWNELLPGLGSAILRQYYYEFSLRDKDNVYGQAIHNLAIEKRMNMEREEFRQFLVQGSDEEHFEWRRSEQALLLAERVASVTLERYPSESDRALLRHVTVEVIGKPNDVDWSTVNRASTKHGVHIGNMLTAELARQPETSIPRWSKLIQSTDADTIKKWCTEPDGAGKTLPMYLIDASFYAREMLGFRDAQAFHLGTQWQQVLQILNDKCPATQWVTTTDKWSPWGMWLNHYKSRSMAATPFQAFLNVLQPINDLGGAISSDVVWSNVHTWDYQTHSITPAQSFSHKSIEEALQDMPEFKDPHLLSSIMTDIVGQHVPQVASARKSKM